MSESNDQLPSLDPEAAESGDVPFANPGAASPNPMRLLFLIVVTDMLGFGLLIPLLPSFARQFNASDFEVTLMLSLYSLCQFVAMPILGRLSDRTGRRPILVYSQAGSAAASITLAIALAGVFHNPATGLLVVFLSRIVDGITGGNLSAAQAYVSDMSAPKQRAKNMGMLGAAFGIGFVLGPVIGGLLGGIHLWLAPAGAAVFSLTAAVLSFLYLPESLKQKHAHAEGHLKASLALLKQPAMAQINVIWFISMFAFVMSESVFALFLSDRFGFTVRQVGTTFGLAGVTIIVVQGRLIGPMTRKIGEWNLAVVGPMIFAAGMFLYGGINVKPILAGLFLAVVVNAFGRSCQTPSLSALVSHQSPSDRQGLAAGLFQGVGSLARVFGPAVAGLMYSRHKGLPFLVAGGMTVVAAALTIFLKSQASTAPTPATLA